MRGLKAFSSLALGCLAYAILSGCAGTVPQNGPGALTIAQFGLAQGVPGVAYRQLLIASGGLTPYTWSISAGSLPPGLSLSNDGIISGTPTTTGTFPFTVQVVDSETPTHAVATQALSIVINPVLSLTSTPLASGVVGSSYSATITASNGVAPYTYTVAAGSLPPCSPNPPCSPDMTVTTNPTPMGGGANSATIGTTTGTNGVTETPTQAGVFNFTIQVTDSVAEVATAVFTITITGELQGNYAINFNGFDHGQPFYLVGSLLAGAGSIQNGNFVGSITGVLDQNGPGSTISTDVPITGRYSLPVNSNGGATGPVAMTLNSSLGTYNLNIALSTTTDSQLIMASASMYGSGLVTKQTTPLTSPSAANYAFGFFGNDSGGDRYAGAGMFALNGSLSVTGGAEDTNDNGVVNGGGASGQPMCITGGTLSAPDPDTGRGTATLDVVPAADSCSGTAVTYNYAYYVVSTKELIAVETDSASGSPATILSILQQQNAGVTGSFSNSSLKGHSVVELDGVSTSQPAAEIGVAAFDGNGNITGGLSGSGYTGPCANPGGTGLWGYCTDESVGGTLSQNTYNGAYNVDSSCGTTFPTPCGRVTVDLSGAPNQPVWYLVTTNQAFAVGTDPAVMAGSLQPQTGSPFTIGSLLGSYLAGTITPTTTSITNEIDVAQTPPPGGIFDITYNSSGPGGVLANKTFMGAYNCKAPGDTSCSTTGSQYGRFEITNSSNQVISIIYIAGTASSGITGGKSGLAGLNVGLYSSGAPDPNPRLSTYGR